MYQNISCIISSIEVCYSLISGCIYSILVGRLCYKCEVRNSMLSSCIRQSEHSRTVQCQISHQRIGCSVLIMMYCNVSRVVSRVVICYYCGSGTWVCSGVIRRCRTYYRIVGYTCRACSICKSRLAYSA